MKHFITYLFATLVAVLCAANVAAQQDVKLLVGADFETFFDNTEYTGTTLAAGSGTIFGSRLTPRIGVEWDAKNSLNFGVDIFNDFGNDTRFFSKARQQSY